MSHSGAHKKVDDENSVREHSDESFRRELAQLNADLARLEASLTLHRLASVVQPQAAQPPQKIQVQAEAPKAASVAAPAPDAPSTPPRQEQTVASAPVLPPPKIPPGTDLADPKNFGLLPPVHDLDRTSASDDEFRQRLARHIAFATKVLHTSRVPAEIWREWRIFEKAALQKLRELANRPVEAAD